MEFNILQIYAISIVLGALIGVERQFSRAHETSKSAIGLRTFIFLSLLGTTSALIAEIVGMLFFAFAFAGVFATLLIAYLVITRQSEDVGVTTEMAAMLVFLIGALVWWDMKELAIALAVAVTVFLSLKETLHDWADRIHKEDIYAALKFAIITFIVLPVLPNKTYGPLNAFNPYETWLVVVLISGIGFVGYILLKIIGPSRGIGIAGLFGGMVSSTAVTLAFSKRSKEAPALYPAFAFVIIIASTTMFPRVLFEVWVVNHSLLLQLIPSMAILAAVGGIFSLWYFLRVQKKTDAEPVQFRNPLDFSMAVKFGLLYAVILFVAQLARSLSGDSGLMFVSALSGFTKIDAIVLSVARLARTELNTHTATQAIVLATLSNTFFKGILVWIIGSPQLRWWVVGALSTILGTGIILYLIPGMM